MDVLNVLIIAVADPGGAASDPPAMGPYSCVFSHVSAKKCPHQRSAPPNGSASPQW